MIKIIGTIAMILLALCSLPELVRTIKAKKCFLGFNLLWMWWIGCGLMAIYVIMIPDWLLFVNYLLNFIIIGIMLIYKLKYK